MEAKKLTKRKHRKKQIEKEKNRIREKHNQQKTDGHKNRQKYCNAAHQQFFYIERRLLR